MPALKGTYHYQSSAVLLFITKQTWNGSTSEKIGLLYPDNKSSELAVERSTDEIGQQSTVV